MPDKCYSDELADLTHRFHEKYRATGIALCISIATVASGECWFFYGLFFESIKNTSNHIQVILWLSVTISAILLFGLSFILQFLHYHGMKKFSRSFFCAYKSSMEPVDNAPKQEMEKEKVEKWDKGLEFFKKADWVVKRVQYLAIFNFIAVIFYIVLYQPIPK